MPFSKTTAVGFLVGPVTFTAERAISQSHSAKLESPRVEQAWASFVTSVPYRIAWHSGSGLSHAGLAAG